MRAQLSMEFILLFTLTFVVFLILVGVAISGFSDRSQDSALEATDALTSSLALHLDLISRGPGAVTYTFLLPKKLDDQSYTLQFGSSGIIIVRIEDAGVVSMRRTIPFELDSLTPGVVIAGSEDQATISVDLLPEDPLCEIGIERDAAGYLKVIVDDC